MSRSMKILWRNRDFSLLLALTAGLLAGQYAEIAEPLVLPARRLVMILSVFGLPISISRYH
ncbi:MAG TPA: hypothetical protein DCY27_01925 [Desulfobacterales bacterium]|nr:hypothetical protein [Desulfobacterales bacterium]